VPKGAERLARAACVAAGFIVASAALADTRTLYRWIDAQGRTQYSDKPPTGFKGEVTRVEVDFEATPAAAPQRAPRVSPEVLRDVVPPPTDINKARREKREKLEAAVRRAEEKVAAAKKALEGGGDIQDDEHQVIQRRYARAQEGKSNCRAVTDANRKTTFICPSIVPNDEYYGRIRGLEDALKKAEEELSEAKTAYMRGVD